MPHLAGSNSSTEGPQPPLSRSVTRHHQASPGVTRRAVQLVFPGQQGLLPVCSAGRIRHPRPGLQSLSLEPMPVIPRVFVLIALDLGQLIGLRLGHSEADVVSPDGGC